jgi:peptide/nickel transport system permease protein
MNQTIKKTGWALACLVVVALINFFLPRMMPGDPVLMLTGMEEEAVSQARYEEYYERLGLGNPRYIQLWDYIKSLAAGDLGYSYHHNMRVSELIAARIPGTLQIAIPAILLSSVLAMVFACFAGGNRGSAPDTLLTAAMVVINAIPGFLLAMLLVTVFAFRLHWFPLGGLSSPRFSLTGTAALGDRIRHLVLPVLSLSLGSMPGKYLLLRNQVAASAEEKYVLYARARGLSRGRILFVHIFRNVCQPFITLIGLNTGFILSGSLIIENIFSIKGMGSLIQQATLARDFPTLQGCLLISAVAVIAADILTRFVCLLVDPKVRYGVHEGE